MCAERSLRLTELLCVIRVLLLAHDVVRTTRALIGYAVDVAAGAASSVVHADSLASLVVLTRSACLVCWFWTSPGGSLFVPFFHVP